MKTTYVNQCSYEALVIPIDFADSLLTGVTVSTATATHTTYPSGSALTITTDVVTPIVYVNVPTGLAVGTNIIKLATTTSDAEQKPGHEIHITTKI